MTAVLVLSLQSTAAFVHVGDVIAHHRSDSRASVKADGIAPPDLATVLASKERLIKAHQEDVELSMRWLSATLRSKEVRKLEDCPGAVEGLFDKPLPGDWGFDPLGLAESRMHLLVYREAEVKHGRLAMLGAAGWPVSELLHEPVAAASGSPSLLQETSGMAPSVLNGGLGQVGGWYWLFAFTIAAYTEISSLSAQFDGMARSEGKPWKYTPGDLNFDPLDLSNMLADKWLEGTETSEGYDRLSMKGDIKYNIQAAEVMHGRVAMLAVTGFAFQEAVWHRPVVEQTPIFFATPVWRLFGDLLAGLHNLAFAP